MNDHRILAAHASFEASGNDGVVFSRSIAKTGLQRTSPTWTEEDCAKMFTEMKGIRKELHVLAQSIAPTTQRWIFPILATANICFLI